MIEITTTRANPLVDPLLHVWAWQIPVYCSFGGLVAGIMVLLGGFHALGPPPACGLGARPAAVARLALLSLGMAALFLDLEHKQAVWRLYTTFQPASPMSWGAWILVAVYPALALVLVAHAPRHCAAGCPPSPRGAMRCARTSPRCARSRRTNLVLGAMLGSTPACC